MKPVQVLAGVSPELEGPLRRYIADQNDMALVDCVYDGAKLVERFQLSGVDVVVVELILPRLDALAVLDHLSRLTLPKRPHVLVVSPTGKESIIRRLLEAGADYCLVKPFGMEILGERIHQFSRGGDSGCRPFLAPATVRSKAPSPALNAKVAAESVAALLSDLGIPTWVNGYRYLCRAISMVMSNEGLLSGVTKIIYPTVARECGSTPSRVERSIRHAIETVWGRGDQDLLHELFGYSRLKQKPTNSEFIAVLADRLREPAGQTRAEGR